MKIEAEGGRGRPSHSRARFAVLARSREGWHDSIRVIRARQKEIYPGAARGEPFRDEPVNAFDVLDAVEPARDARLVRQDGHRHLGPVEASDRLGGPRDELDP